MNQSFTPDHIELYVPMAKPLAYWHVQALGFSIVAYKGIENGHPGISSYVLQSNNIRLVLTSAYPSFGMKREDEILSFIHTHYSGVKRLVLTTTDVSATFAQALSHGAIPVRFPRRQSDDNGYIEEAAIRLYDHSEIVFLDRENYSGVFKPGYGEPETTLVNAEPLFDN